jgi:hypothetical protein
VVGGAQAKRLYSLAVQGSLSLRASEEIWRPLRIAFRPGSLSLHSHKLWPSTAFTPRFQAYVRNSKRSGWMVWGDGMRRLSRDHACMQGYARLLTR